MARPGDINIGTSWGEMWKMIIASSILGFAISFRDWGFGNQFIASVGIINLFLATLVCTFSIWLRTSMQKRAGRTELATVRFEYSWINLVYTFLLAFITNGFFIFAALGRPTVKSLTHLRPGYLNPHLGHERVARIVMAGTITSILLLVFAKFWLAVGGGVLAEYLFRTNAWMLIISLIPIPAEGISLFYQKAPITRTFHQMYPPLANALKQFAPRFEGEQIFFGSRPLWFFITVISVVFLGLINTSISITATLLWSVIFGVAGVIFWWYLEYKKFKVKLIPKLKKKK